MKKIYAIIGLFFATVLIVCAVNFAFAEDRELTDKEKAAFIVRQEWTDWTTAFTASLSELDAKATKKIYNDMDFYDMQYRFTSTYKNNFDPSTEKESYESYEKLIKELIKKKRKEINKE